MKRTYVLLSLAAALGSALLIVSPVESQTAGSFAALQAAPSIAQPGFVRISQFYYGKGGNFATLGDGTSVFADVNGATGNNFYALNNTPNYPGVISFVSGQNNAAVWSRNTATGAYAFLSYLGAGVDCLGSATGPGIIARKGALGVAGNFIGDVLVSEELQGSTAQFSGAPGMDTVQATANGNFVALRTQTASNITPGIIGEATHANGTGLRGYNSSTGSYADLGLGITGVYGFANSTGYAGYFNGNVRTGFLTVNMPGTGAYPLEVAQPVATTSMSGARILADGQSDASIHPGGQYWRAGLEAAGPNGLIGGTTRAGGFGVIGFAPTTRGVFGRATDTTGTNYGVYGETASSTNGFGVYSGGRFAASGTKSFRIDHPLDPENKYLAHYCTEGEEPLNVYRGEVTTDAQGYATVALPDFYEAINVQPTIQLTVLDESEDFVMAKVVSRVKDGAFRLRSSRGGTVVFWRVEARRNDRFVARHGAPVEIEKAAENRGLYQHPELYGYGDDRKEGRQRQGTDARPMVVLNNAKTFGAPPNGSLVLRKARQISVPPVAKPILGDRTVAIGK